jgi:oligosaccharide reducing-end xylanase
MKKILFFAVLLSIVNTGYSRTIASPYEVGKWRGFRTAAVSYTFDDGCANTYTIAIPMFNEFDFKMTLYPVINWGPNWTALQNAAAVGHEIGSHTMSHPSTAASEAELANSQIAINSHIPGRQCVTIAYPNCVVSNQTITAKYYIAGRICNGAIEASTPSNFFQIGSMICGNSGSLNTAAAFTTKFSNAVSTQGWCVFLIHGIDSDGGYSPLPSTVLRSSIEYLDAHRETFWVENFGNVVRYIKERNDVSVAETANTGESMTVQVTDTLNDANYSYPVTIRRPLPEGWAFANVKQNGVEVESTTVKVGTIKYVMFDVVPDKGDVVLTKGVYGDFNNNNSVDAIDLSSFKDLWLQENCDYESDIDGNCMINFIEFASFAENWMHI